MAVVWIPPLARDLTGGAERVSAAGSTLAEVIDALEERYPGVKARLVEDGRLRPTLSAVIDGETDARLRAKVAEGSEVFFLPRVSGG